MPFALAGAAIGAGATIYSANQQSNAIQKGQNNANAMAEKAQGVARDTFSPYMGAGTNALSAYGNLLGINGPEAADAAMANFRASPGFQYQMQQGLQAVDHGAAARGMLRSGETLRAEQNLGDQLASQDFGNYMSRLNNLTNAGLQGSGAYLNAFTGQANNIQSTDTSGAASQAGIYNNEMRGVTGSINSGLNSLGQMYQSGSGLFGPGTQAQQTNALMDGPAYNGSPNYVPVAV